MDQPFYFVACRLHNIGTEKNVQHMYIVVVVVVVVVFSFIKQLSDATDSKMGFTIKQFTEETRIH